MNSKILFVVFLLFLTVAYALTPITLQKNKTSFIYMQEWLEIFKPHLADEAAVFSNVDGDTVKIYLKNKIETVRMIGVDTPETVHPRKPVQYFGKMASTFTKLMLKPSEKVKLTYDWNPRDKYRRLLAYVWFKVEYQGKEYWILHNLALIVNGYGHAYTVFPFKDLYMETFKEAERYARENYIGLWSGINETKALELLKSGKIIKGNYSGTSTKVYSTPSAVSSTSYNVKIITIHYKGSDEYIVIKNTGNTAVNLSGWRLWSKGNQWYTFSNITLQPGQSISIHSGPKATGIVWTKKYVWNNNGDEAVLYDSSGNVADRYAY